MESDNSAFCSLEKEELQVEWSFEQCPTANQSQQELQESQRKLTLDAGMSNVAQASMTSARNQPVASVNATGKVPFGFSCYYCEKRYNRRHSLKRHHESKHAEKEFVSLGGSTVPAQGHYHVCGVCNKAFWDSFNLNRHILTHSNVRPFKCPICSKRFKRISHLDTHIYDIHYQYGSFECEVCKKVFIAEGKLHIHRRSHSGQAISM